MLNKNKSSKKPLKPFENLDFSELIEQKYDSLVIVASPTMMIKKSEMNIQSYFKTSTNMNSKQLSDMDPDMPYAKQVTLRQDNNKKTYETEEVGNVNQI